MVDHKMLTLRFISSCLPASERAGFVRLMVLDAQGELRPLVVEQ